MISYVDSPMNLPNSVGFVQDFDKQIQKCSRTIQGLK